ncbi:MAG: BatA and WFA domain-containing protein [Pirellulales bacterium]|nr:BatA and WFA domain-containing protein [Pirellulales bacterium]
MPSFMPMLTWWQWTILAAVPPAIVLLYFLKLKRHPVEVPSTFLWHKSIEDLHVNAIWQRLRNNLLLWLQLLLILLLALALFRPSWQGTKLVGERFIFLIDNSASMSADDRQPSRLASAKEKVHDLIEGMKSGQAAMVISFADAARVEQSYSDNRTLLHRAVDGIKPTARGTSLLEALKLASGLANPGRSAEKDTDTQVAEALPATLYILSDGKFPPVAGIKLGNLEPKFLPIGLAESKNIGILAFSAQRNESRPDRFQAFARLENFCKEKTKVAGELYLDDHLVDADEVEVTPEEPRGIAFDIAAVESGVLRLKIKSKDQLKIDDEAFLVLRMPQRTKVLLVTPGNEPLAIALTTKSAQEIAEVQIEPPEFLKNKVKYQTPAAAGTFDLVIYDRCHPEQMPQANTLFIADLPPKIANSPPEKNWTAGAKVDIPQIIDIDSSHPLLQWMDMSDVVLLSGTPLKPPVGGKVLIDSDAGSPSGAMLAIAPRDAFEDVVLGFSFFEEQAGEGGKTARFYGTNWYSRQSFPVFVRNLFEYFGRNRVGANSEGYRPGQSVQLDVTAAEAKVRVKTPSGSNVDLRSNKSGKLSFTETSELGIYDVQTGGKSVDRFAVNLFDPAESDIRPNPSPSIKVGEVEVEGEATSEAARKDFWKTLALFGLAVLAGEWYIYSRRIY